MRNPGPAPHPMSQVRKTLGRWRVWLASGGLAVCMGCSLAAERPPLLLVQPMDRVMPANAVVQHFARWLPHYLGDKAVLHRDSNGKGLEGIAWAGSAAPPERTVLLMSQLWQSRLDTLPASTPGARNWVPVQVVLLGTWCLMAQEDRHLPDYAALHAWLRTLGRPVRLGVPHRFGLPELWMQAMAHKTDLPWVSRAFPLQRQSIQALETGAVDVVLERCSDASHLLDGRLEVRKDHPKVQLLAQQGLPASEHVPGFVQWQLPPIAPGWMAWFVRAEMSADRQEAVGRALHAILLRDDTQALIAALQQQPVRMSQTDSQRFVRRTQAQGQSLQQWLEHAADPLLGVSSLVP